LPGCLDHDGTTQEMDASCCKPRQLAERACRREAKKLNLIEKTRMIFSNSIARVWVRMTSKR
jgi:hypothetical protein